MYKKIITLVILSHLLMGCQDTETIKYPNNLTFENEVLSWDAVKDATSYTIRVNDQEYTVDETLFRLDIFQNGSYDIRVQTHSGSNKSYFSPSLTIEIDRVYPDFEWILLNGDILSWSEIPDALNYEVYINEEQFTTIHTTYDLSTLSLDDNSLYTVSIGAKFQSTDVILSDSLIYHTYLYSEISFEIQHDQSGANDVNIQLNESTQITHIVLNQQLINPSLYQFIGNSLTITGETFNSATLGENILLILTPNGYIQVFLDIINPLNPTITSPDVVTYITQKDMEFSFDLHGGSFIGLSGNDIASTDYLFADNKLTIYASYIEEILQNNPARETVILVYQLQKNNDVTMGFIFINIPQE